MTIKSVVDAVQLNLKHFGLMRTVYDVLIRGLSHFLFFKILKVIRLPEVSGTYHLPEKYDYKEISPEQFQAIALNREYEIPHRLVQEMSQRGNICYGIFDNGVLANYVLMYSSSARITEDLIVCFDSSYGYLCNTFTHPQFRGEHLSSIGVALASNQFFGRGFQELLAYVESHNFSSLKSLYRIGWRDVDTIYVVRLLGRYFIRTGSACRRYGFRVEVIPEAATELPAAPKVRTTSAR
jgi:hypothetical protein